MDLKTPIILIIILLYNVLLGVFIIQFTVVPTLAISVISVDFFFILLYAWMIVRERYRGFKFRKEHSELIRQAEAELRSMKT